MIQLEKGRKSSHLLEDIMLSEVSQPPQDEGCIIPRLCSAARGQFIETDSRGWAPETGEGEVAV